MTGGGGPGAKPAEKPKQQTDRAAEAAKAREQAKLAQEKKVTEQRLKDRGGKAAAPGETGKATPGEKRPPAGTEARESPWKKDTRTGEGLAPEKTNGSAGKPAEGGRDLGKRWHDAGKSDTRPRPLSGREALSEAIRKTGDGTSSERIGTGTDHSLTHVHDGRIKDALGRAGKFMDEGTKKTVEGALRDPDVNLLKQIVQPGVRRQWVGKDVARRLGGALDMAAAAETPEASDAAAREFAGVLKASKLANLLKDLAVKTPERETRPKRTRPFGEGAGGPPDVAPERTRAAAEGPDKDRSAAGRGSADRPGAAATELSADRSGPARAADRSKRASSGDAGPEPAVERTATGEGKGDAAADQARQIDGARRKIRAPSVEEFVSTVPAGAGDMSGPAGDDMVKRVEGIRFDAEEFKRGVLQAVEGVVKDAQGRAAETTSETATESAAERVGKRMPDASSPGARYRALSPAARELVDSWTNRRYELYDAPQDAIGRKLDANNPADKPLIEKWLKQRDTVMSWPTNWEREVQQLGRAQENSRLLKDVPARDGGAGRKPPTVLREEMSMGELQAYVKKELDSPGSQRDIAAANIVARMSGTDLAKAAAHSEGAKTLVGLYKELVTGSRAQGQMTQATRVLNAIQSTRDIQSTEAGIAKGTRVFPARFTMLGAAHMTTELTPDGLIRVKIPQQTMGDKRFASEIPTLPPDTFTKGLLLRPDEMVGFRLYDEGGITVHRPALYLLDLGQQSTNEVYKGMRTTASLAAPGGFGVAGGLFARGALRVAEKTIDIAATSLIASNALVHESRGWLVEKLGDKGRAIVEVWDRAAQYASIYGAAKAAAVPLLKERLASAWSDARVSARSLTGADRDRMQSMERSVKRLMDDLDDAHLQLQRGGRSASAEGPASGAGTAHAPPVRPGDAVQARGAGPPRDTVPASTRDTLPGLGPPVGRQPGARTRDTVPDSTHDTLPGLGPPSGRSPGARTRDTVPDSASDTLPGQEIVPGRPPGTRPRDTVPDATSDTLPVRDTAREHWSGTLGRRDRPSRGEGAVPAGRDVPRDAAPPAPPAGGGGRPPSGPLDSTSTLPLYSDRQMAFLGADASDRAARMGLSPTDLDDYLGALGRRTLMRREPMDGVAAIAGAQLSRLESEVGRETARRLTQYGFSPDDLVQHLDQLGAMGRTGAQARQALTVEAGLLDHLRERVCGGSMADARTALSAHETAGAAIAFRVWKRNADRWMARHPGEAPGSARLARWDAQADRYVQRVERGLRGTGQR